MTHFILLSDQSGNWRRTQGPLAREIAPRNASEPADPAIEVADLSPQDLRDAALDPSVLAIQQTMPTRLLTPQPIDGLRIGDTAPGWGLRATGADWTSQAGAGVRMALLDTGIDANHPVFAGVTISARDFAGTGIEDANGHGTHVAATILGRDLGGTRIGVARGITDLLVGKVVADDGRGRSEDFLRSLLWALDEKADVVGFALTFDTPAKAEALAEEGYPTALAASAAINTYRGNLRICEMLFRMIGGGNAPLIIGAVGNDSLRTIAPEFETGPSAPAAAQGVLAVGACGPDETGLAPAPFTNAGAAVVAPGVGIVSAGLDGGLRPLNGTSMALAYTAGIAALWIEHMRENGETVTAQSVAAKLVGTATKAPLGPQASLVDCGRGLVQAPQAALDHRAC